MKLKWDLWFRAAMWFGTGLTAMSLAWIACAQSIGTTTVHGTVYMANGTPGSGSLQLSWPAFTTADNHAVTAGRTTVTIGQDGNISVNLAPNQGSTPAGLYYTAVYHMNDGTTSTEYWVVPPGDQVSIAQVRAQVMPAAQAVQAVNKAYVDQAVQSINQGTLMSTGGTMTGPLGFSGLQTVISTRENLHIKEVNPLDYGAVADAQSTVDGAISSGSASLSSASALFTPASCGAGKLISVQGAGAAGATLITSCTYVDSSHLALATPAGSTVGGAGLIWGTDNYSAFAAAVAAAAGKRLHITGPGSYLISNPASIAVASNTVYDMDRSATLFTVGVSSSVYGLFAIPGHSQNIEFKGLNCSGEYQNPAIAIPANMGQTACIFFDGYLGGTKNVQIHDGLYQNLFGNAIEGYSGGLPPGDGWQDVNVDISHNTFRNTGNTAINYNGDNANISFNYFSDGWGVEIAGARSTYNYNKFENIHGTYVMQLGGYVGSAGTPPTTGVEAIGNIIINPTTTGGGISVGTGCAHAIIAHNQFLGMNHAQSGITVAYSGVGGSPDNTLVDSNFFQGTASNLAMAAVSLYLVNGTILRNNVNDSGWYYGVSSGNSTNTDSSGNTWSGTAHDVNLDQNSTGWSLHDRLANSGAWIVNGSTITPDTCFATGGGNDCKGGLFQVSSISGGAVQLLETTAAGVAGLGGLFPNQSVWMAWGPGGSTIDSYYAPLQLAVGSTVVHTITATSDTSTVPEFFPTAVPGTNSKQGATTAFVANAIAAANPVLKGTSASIGGSALTAGNCASGTVPVTGSTTSMAVVVTPVTYPGDAYTWHGYVSATNTVTVKVCTNLAAGGTPTASAYIVRVIQ